MTDKEKIRATKFMSLVLRHNPQKIGITLDKKGRANVVIKGIHKKGHKVTLDNLKEVVSTNDKQKFKNLYGKGYFKYEVPFKNA